jgi:dTDP-4-dehydrorhamnose reductase
MPKLLVTGGSGMLGSYTATRAAAAGWDVTATYFGNAVELPGCLTVHLDLADPWDAVGSICPDVIIHTAAQVKPDVCEEQKRLAFDTNVVGTDNLLRAAECVHAHFIHVSTDLVFSGEKNSYSEGDLLTPPNYYGLTKAAAEAAVLASETETAIVRTSIIYGPRMLPHLNSFSDKIIESLRAGKPMTAFTDQRRCPIPAWNLADVLLEIAERRLTGIFHAVCPESSTRYEFALKVAEAFGLDTSLIRPATMDQVPAAAHRPHDLILDTSTTQARLSTRLQGFEEGITALLHQTSL